MYDYCHGGREGRLCGSCKPGHGLRFFSDRCSSNSDCNDAAWAAPLLLAISLAMAVWLLISTRNRQSGVLAVLLFFFQMSSFVKQTPFKHAAPGLVSTVQAVFNLAPPSSGDYGLTGVCLFGSMTTSQKMGARLW